MIISSLHLIANIKEKLAKGESEIIIAKDLNITLAKVEKLIDLLEKKSMKIN